MSYYIKVGYNGVYIIWTCYPDVQYFIIRMIITYNIRYNFFHFLRYPGGQSRDFDQFLCDSILTTI